MWGIRLLQRTAADLRLRFASLRTTILKQWMNSEMVREYSRNVHERADTIHGTFAILSPGCDRLKPDSGSYRIMLTLTTTSRIHEGAGLSQTVFVLEDDTDISRLVQHHLEAAGFAVRVYGTPANIVADAERQAPALFLLDIMVPGGDGLDVCRRLRSHSALSTVPIIFLTARAGENDRVLGLELGADDYITKPFATREMVARVKAVLRRFERPTTP